jgi:hypothetical protein
LSNCGGCTITDSQGVGTITNDDSAPATTTSLGGGEYTTAQSITLTANKPATIHYTTNGDTPTPFSTVYNSPIHISTTTTLKFFAIDTSGNEETVQTQVYTINSGGCLIATATFGSELSSQVQQLREIRDNNLMNTQTGASFMTGFNQFYYTFSPTVADWERENPAFKELVKIGITPMLTSLSILSLADSDQEVLGLGIGVILMNIGMYFALPIFLIVRIKKHFKK